jgi:hypothetical protein
MILYSIKNYLLMKKKEKPLVMNNQEDEDGYTLYPENAIMYENEKKRLAVCNNLHVVNTAQVSSKEGLYGGVRASSRP